MNAVGERNDFGLTAWDRYRILTSYRTIAMVGLSSNFYNASSFAAVYLDANGYDIVPVNPSQAGKREILGRAVHASVLEAAREHPVEIVDVFRPSHEVTEIARQAIEVGAKVLWMQLGVVNEEAAALAREAGLEVVMDRCCKIEHARFFGGLRTIGLNTGVITSRLAMRLPEG
ncbi:MAG: CoA-binding protein [Candidatus Dormibacteraeota bacterium]|nr:CoA-binding protein [Candidatus Dormibacteraeota bacterium]